MFVKIAMIVVFFAVLILVGVASRRSSKGLDGFVLGGRSVGPWLTAFSFGTSYFSAVIFIGYAGRFGWNFGLASTWIGLGNAFIGSLLAWVVLGRRTRVMTQHLGSRTMPDFFGLRFSSRALRLVSAVIVFVFLIPYTASLFNGLSQLFSTAFSGIGYVWWVLIMAVLTGVYVIVGGYMGAAVNNFIQGMIMLVGIVAVIGSVLADQGGLTEAIAKLSADAVTTAQGTVFSGAFVSFLGPQPLQLLGVVILTSLGTWGLPQMVGKFYAIKDEGAIQKGTIISTAFALIVAGGCYFLGGFGRLFANEIALTEAGAPQSFDTIVPAMLKAVTDRLGGRGDWLMGLVLILVLSASMSTLASLVMASASTITLDLVAVVRKKRAEREARSETRDMLLMRVLIAVSIAVAAAIAILTAYDKEAASRLYISDLMGISWGTLAGCFLAPFLFGLFWKKTTRPAVWASFVTGLGITMTEFVLTSVLGIRFENAFMAYFFNSAINAGMLAMLAGLIVVPFVSLLTKKKTPGNVDEMFSCYDRTVTVPVSTALSKED
ncbi:MAG: sodium:solute symporter [Lachnospiraceae bacterium]|nr:sodium:solute symporter [Lachnospiraceae bacterium]